MQPLLRLTALSLLAALAIHAHATVWPEQSTPGGFEKYTLRVPNEKPSPTVKLEVEYPAALSALYFEAKPGWTIEHRKDASGRILGTTWSGGSIGPEQFAEFQFMARNPAQPGDLVFRAIQTHADGTRSEWTGEPGSKNPAPIVTIAAPSLPQPAESHHH